jgi:hypothetical protein
MERGLCSAPLLNFALRIMLGIINAKTYSRAINGHSFASKNISLHFVDAIYIADLNLI